VNPDAMLPNLNAPLPQHLQAVNLLVHCSGFRSVAEVLQHQRTGDAQETHHVRRNFLQSGQLLRIVARAFSSVPFQTNNIKDPTGLLLSMRPFLLSICTDKLKSLSVAIRKSMDQYTHDNIVGFSFAEENFPMHDRAANLYMLLTDLISTSDDGQQQLQTKVALSVLAYAKSQKSNRPQGHLGYFLVATNNVKRAIDTLHKLSLSVAYESVRNMMDKIAESSKCVIREKVFKLPLVLSYDNMNYQLEFPANVETLKQLAKGH
jgi:hypothetical protein